MLQNFTARLTQKKEPAPGTLWMRFALIAPPLIEFTAGQYVVLNVPQDGRRDGPRLYSICSPDYQKKEIDLLVHAVPGGLASGYLNGLQEGGTISFRGPAGRFILREDDCDKIFLATGAGIGPIRSQLQSYFHRRAYTPVNNERRPAMRLFWGVRTRPEAYFAEEFEELKKQHPNFIFTICLSRETSLGGFDPDCFKAGRITDLFDNHPVSPKAAYYLCGAPDVVSTISEFLVARGADKTRIFFEKF